MEKFLYTATAHDSPVNAVLRNSYIMYVAKEPNYHALWRTQKKGI